MQKNTFHKRLQDFIGYLQISEGHFDRLMQFSNGYTAKMLKDEGSIGSDKLIRIFSKYPELNPTWLLTGRGAMLLDLKKLENQNTTSELEKQILELQAQVQHLQSQKEALMEMLERLK